MCKYTCTPNATSAHQSQHDTEQVRWSLRTDNLPQALRTRALVVNTLLPDSLRLLSNFATNYTSGLTRVECAQNQRPNAAKQLRSCDPVIYGGIAYELLYRSIDAPTEAIFRSTTDIDVHVPFVSHTKKDDRGSFRSKHASRALKVAQDRVLEFAELLNMSSSSLVQTLSEQGTTIHDPQTTREGLIDANALQQLARKRPSSRFDQVLAVEAGWGPFFVSKIEHEAFHTFKVCYVFSENTSKSDCQYAELVEFQMFPVVSRRGPSGLEVKVEDHSNGLSLVWTDTDLNDKTAAPKTNHNQNKRARLWIETPAALADASGLAVYNRLSRHCWNDGDWEKVLTDEKRAAWLQEVSQSDALSQVGIPSHLSQDIVEACQSVLDLRIEDPVEMEYWNHV